MVAARLAIVTGPNMAGKSTFLRQNALLAILDPSGSFVTAQRLKLGVVDQLLMSAVMCLISAWLAVKLHRACD